MFTIQHLYDFQNQGFVKLENQVPAGLLGRLRSQFNQIMENPQVQNDVGRYARQNNSFVTNIENICNKNNCAALELLAQPAVLQVAAAICGPAFFPIQDFAVIKNRGDNLPVLWHQDMLNSRSAPACTMGIYLDDASETEGALRIVPGSHATGESICAAAGRPAIAAPMHAGDILVHDMLVAHCSPPLREQEMRRVIYFEFLSPELVRAEEIYTEALIARRTLLLAAAFRFREEQGHENTFHWQHPEAENFLARGSWEEMLQEVYTEPVRARCSTYCFDAPVPGMTENEETA